MVRCGQRACRAALPGSWCMSLPTVCSVPQCKRTNRSGEFARCPLAFASVRWYCIGAHALPFHTAEGGHTDEIASDTRSDAARTAPGPSARTGARHRPAGTAAARRTAPGHAAARARLRHADRALNARAPHGNAPCSPTD
ncbi:hypothetical protein Bcen2424_3470 [Burkholderia cenocepacia HI2424]|nr:hypothetical protein Bcen2424_3470 [Burkholderia cenocepacia HI2424]